MVWVGMLSGVWMSGSGPPRNTRCRWHTNQQVAESLDGEHLVIGNPQALCPVAHVCGCKLPPDFTVLGKTLCVALPPPAVERTPRSSSCERRDECPGLTFPSGLGQAIYVEQPKLVRTPGNTNRHTCSAFMAPPPPHLPHIHFMYGACCVTRISRTEFLLRALLLREMAWTSLSPHSSPCGPHVLRRGLVSAFMDHLGSSVPCGVRSHRPLCCSFPCTTVGERNRREGAAVHSVLQ